MRRLVLAEVWNRRARSLALLAGIVSATAAFAVFTGTADTQQLQLRGTVARNFRSSYDILVRPRGSETALERTQGLVRDNYLSGIFGGISLQQYDQIQHIPGVAVAAPIAMIGYVLQPVQSSPAEHGFKVVIPPARTPAGRRLYSVDVTRTTDRGLVHLVDQRGYVYATDRPLRPPQVLGGPGYFGPTEQVTSGRSVLVCPAPNLGSSLPGAFSRIVREQNLDTCLSTQPGGASTQPDSGLVHGRLEVDVEWWFPFLLAAIDPRAEARLDGLSTAVTHGRYLRPGAAPTVESYEGSAHIVVPVLASTRPFVDDSDEVTVSQLSGRAAQAVVKARTPEAMDHLVDTARPRKVIARRTFTVSAAYRRLLRTLGGSQLAVIDNYWTSGPTAYRQLGPRELTPLRVVNPPSTWSSEYYWPPYVFAPIDSSMAAYRTLHPHIGIGNGQQTIHLPTLHAVGEFDPGRIHGGSALGRVPLGFTPAEAAPADARSRELLHGRDLLPDSNLAGYLQPPPLLLTDLNSLSAFSDPLAFPTGNSTAPISVIRVRVAGVNGDDALSRERVRLVAQRIEQTTGLQVDITIGSSPTPMTIDLPPGSGRPALKLTEGWVKKGVAVAILAALDRKSLILFALILLVCGLFVYNAASASVQTRRPQLGVLAALGWTAPKLFTATIGELAIIGAAGGLLGAIVALPIAAAAGFNASILHAALAIPAALLLATLAGILPAIRAARMTPAAAVRPAALTSGHGWTARSIRQMALINLARVPARNLIAALSLALGVAALTLLLAITIAFHNALVGTLLGNVVALQARPTDYAAVIVTILLAGASLTDVLYLNLRQRAPEIATLHATGWHQAALSRLIGYEALAIGLVGSLTGAGAGLAAATTFAGALPASLIITTIIAAATGLAVAILAAIIPATLITRLPTVPLLAGE